MWAEVEREMYFTHTGGPHKWAVQEKEETRGERTCTKCIRGEWEHKDYPRSITTLVHLMWRAVFASSQMACQSDAGKQGKWE